MTYLRVIPRDLFNEANLLKCYGQLYLQLEVHSIQGVELIHDDNTLPFDVRQYEDDGSLTVWNINLSVRGDPVVLFRPLNSREPWPLYALWKDDEEIPIFTDKGEFTLYFLDFLKGGIKDET